MAALNPEPAELSGDERQVLASWLEAFEAQWDERLLANRAAAVPPGSSWRLPALAGMVKIDLQRQWQQGRRVSLGSYLEQFPELGGPGEMSSDLIRAEYEIRRRFGAPVALEEYLGPFPHLAAELGRLIVHRDRTEPWRPSSLDPIAGARPSELPEQFGRYRIIQRLGQGGMGSVYMAEDTRLGRRVALKVPDLGPSDGLEARQRFLEEARTAATLDHPYLCPVFDAGEIDGRLYLTMAYIEGQSLAALIGSDGWPARQAAALVRNLALAMQEAHAKNVIHRDLKPANIMIRSGDPAGEPVIVDFGLARRGHAGEARLTRTGQVLGTIGAMAPEQIRGDAREVGPACDIYALGVMLYELLTGRQPFEGKGLAIVGRILTQTPVSPTTIRPDLDPRLEAICLKAMARRIGDRHASMAELAAVLGGFLDDRGAPVARVSKPKARRRLWFALTLAAGFSTALLGGVVHELNRPAPRTVRLPQAAYTVPKPKAEPESSASPRELRNSVGMTLVRIPAGEFMMGMASEASQDLRRFVEGRGDVGWFDQQFRAAPVHRVTLTRPWLMGATEVTIGQFRKFVEATGYVTTAEQYGFGNSGETTIDARVSDAMKQMNWRTPGYAVTDDSPVSQVSWNDAVAFCNWLSEQENLKPCYRHDAETGWSLAAGGNGYRLPTEAEWEYACRAGAPDEPTSAERLAWLQERAWFDANSRAGASPVARKPPNDFGLFDMRGNVFEWCHDWYDAGSYLRSPSRDPAGPATGDNRVQRGGGWPYEAVHCHAAFRTWAGPLSRADHRGFRVVRVATDADSADFPVAPTPIG
jgi:formylglycine-generating enzyme required for sulfatase activity